jgi:GNAT superfamily N-acetyltransferase
MADWVIQRLSATHGRAEFTCGNPALDSFIQSLVSQYEKRRLGRTVVATIEGQSRVAGYYTLAAGTVDIACLPASVRKKLPRHPIPTVHLARLAVDLAFRGQGLGETLLMHALQSALETSHKLGAFAVDVVAVDHEAAKFYQKYGFEALMDEEQHLYLPMKTVAAMFED